MLGKTKPTTFPDRPGLPRDHSRLGASGPMPVSFILAMFVLPAAIIGVAVVLAKLSRRADGNKREDRR